MTRRSELWRALGGALLVSTLLGCGSTVDSLGSDPETPSTLHKVSLPASYPNTFKSLLGKSDSEISNKVNDAFDQLFGDVASQRIYLPDQYPDQPGGKQAAILDVFHGNARTEGMGLGMLIAVELADQDSARKQDIFDQLWSYAKAQMLQKSGPARGYFSSHCGEGPQGDKGTECLDPYGMQQFVLALIFAHNLWGSSATQPYARDALALLDALQNKSAQNEGMATNIVSTFDPTTHLVREEPTLAAAGYTRSSLEMPASYELWAQATGDTFWSDAADAARTHLVDAADATTGLWPIRSYFDASPVQDAPAPAYTGQAYRTQLNLAMDALWGTATADETAVADRVLGFFAAQTSDPYAGTFTLDGTPIDTNPSQALIAVNGALAVASSRADRKAFVNAVWAQAIPSDEHRYYDGLLYLMSLLVLSGQLRVH